MSISKLELVDQATAILGEQHDPRISVDRIINDAGTQLFGMHSWNWRSRPSVDLDFVANQEFVNMPPDFGSGELLYVRQTANVNFGVTVTSLALIDDLRANSVTTTGGHYWVSLSFPTQAALTIPPVQTRLEVYPTPTSATASALTVGYRAGWIELNDDNSVANIPPAFDSLLVNLVRARAIYYKTNDLSPVDAILQSATFHLLKRQDGAAQAGGQPRRGGILHGRAGLFDPLWNFTVSETPV